MGNLNNFDRAQRKFDSDEIDENISDVRAQLSEIVSNAKKDDILILSHEDLTFVKTLRRLREFLKEAAGQGVRTNILAYVRHPVRHYPSSIQQVLKGEKIKSFLPSEWQSNHSQGAERLAEYANKRLTLRLHAPADKVGWDVIEDFREYFCETTGKILPPVGSIPPVNSSLSAQACALLELGRALKGPPGAEREFRQRVRKFDIGQPATRLVVPTAWNAQIVANNAVNWNRILSLVDASPEAKRLARLSEVQCPAVCTEDDVRRWLLSYLDLDYMDRLIPFCRLRSRHAPVRPWLKSVLASIREKGLDEVLGSKRR